MATYVNDLRLTELATGEGSGSWGTTTNVSLELIGEALGYATQQAFGSDADATTTVADGASDPARAMYYKITSAASLTATRTLTIAPNTISRVMFIENATTGSQSIAISQGSGANVTIATGKTAVVYLDGAGSGAAVVDAMAGVDPGVTDTLAEVLAAGNTTTTDQKIQFRDTGIYINSSVDGQLDLVADTEIQIAATTIDVNGTLAFDSLKGTGATTVTNILDEDNMASDSATAIATQQSIKAYVDSQVGSFDTLAEVLAQGNTTGGTDISVTSGDKIVTASNDNLVIEPGGTGNVNILTDTLAITAAEGESASLVLSADESDDNPDIWRVTSNTDNTLTIGNQISGSVVEHITITPNATVANSLASFAGKLTTAGVITANAGVVVDNFTLDGTTLALSSGDLTLDVAGDIILDADTGVWRFKDAGTTLYQIAVDGAAVVLYTGVSDADMIFKGNDGGSTVTALTLDMSAAGAATFNSTLATTELNVSQSANSTRSYKLLQGYGYTTGGNYYGQYAIGTTYNSAANTGTLEFFTGSGSSAPTNRLTIDSSGNTVFNETGIDSDFRVESSGDANALFVDGGTNSIGIGTGAPSSTYKLDVAGAVRSTANAPSFNLQESDASNQHWVFGSYAGILALRDVTGGTYPLQIANSGVTTNSLNLTGTETVVNDNSADRDFRVESDGNANMLFVNGENNSVAIGGGNDNSAQLFVEGNIRRGGYLTLSNFNSNNDAIAFNYKIAPSATTVTPIYSGSGSAGGSFIHMESGGGGTLDFRSALHGTDASAFAYTEAGKYLTMRPTAKAQGELVVNQDSNANIDFRVESDADAYMLFVDAGNNSVGIGTNATGSTALVVQAASGAGAISIIGRASGGIGTISFYDDNGTSNVGYLQGRADDNEFRLWTTTADTLSLGQNDADRLQINNEGIITKSGHLGNSYTDSHPFWVISTFNDNAHVTSGSVTVSTSASEWQPALFKVSAASIDTDQSDPGAAVYYVRMAFLGSGAGVINTTTGFEDGANMSLAVTASTVSSTSVLVNFVVTGTGNRTVGTVEALAYGKIIDSARTG